MRRHTCAVRPDWARRCEEVGFTYHSMNGPYWNEGAAYAFTAAQVDHLEAVTVDLHERMLAAVDWIVARGHYEPFNLPPLAIAEIERSWKRGDASLYGRFDFSWDGHGDPHLLEYNADTPTALLEASVVQWFWLRDVMPAADQFNSIHEQLIARWRQMSTRWPRSTRVHFAACADHVEDQGNTAYLLDTAVQAGLAVSALHMEDIGWSPARTYFCDRDERPITHCFKLYPWEWMFADAFGVNVTEASTLFIEPAWKLLLSCKAILPIVHALNPRHPNLLPASFRADLPVPYVRKPLYSREGHNVSLVLDTQTLHSDGPYGVDGCIYQAAAPLPDFDGRYPVIGAWIVGDRAAGMGIREDHGPITANDSQFVPHYFM